MEVRYFNQKSMIYYYEILKNYRNKWLFRKLNYIYE